MISPVWFVLGVIVVIAIGLISLAYALRSFNQRRVADGLFEIILAVILIGGAYFMISTNLSS